MGGCYVGIWGHPGMLVRTQQHEVENMQQLMIIRYRALTLMRVYRKWGDRQKPCTTADVEISNALQIQLSLGTRAWESIIIEPQKQRSSIAT